jgi:hypothetical protein
MAAGPIDRPDAVTQLVSLIFELKFDHARLRRTKGRAGFIPPLDGRNAAIGQGDGGINPALLFCYLDLLLEHLAKCDHLRFVGECSFWDDEKCYR